MTIKEMQDNIVGKYGEEAEETKLFSQLCKKLNEDNVVNNAILKLCHNSLLGIIDRDRVKQVQEQEEELLKRTAEIIVKNKLEEEDISDLY